MSGPAGRSLPGALLVHGGVLVLVVLWTLPTIGLAVTSLRDKDQLAASGWWTAFAPSEQTAFARTGPPDSHVNHNGVYVLSGNVFGEAPGTVTAFGWRAQAPTAFKAGETVNLPGGRTLSVTADGSYRLTSPVPWTGKRGKRIFYAAEEPPRFTVENYLRVVTAEGLGRSFLNSLTVAVPATAIPILIAAFAAYAFAWMRFPGRSVLFAAVVALLVVPLQMALIPLLRLYNDIGNALGVDAKSYLGIWLAHTGFGLPLALYILHSAVAALPRDLIEAARIDGASHVRIFTRIVLPLAFPALAAFAIFQFLWVWNDLLIAMVFLGNGDDQLVLTGRLRELLGSRGGDWEILAASAFVSLVVPLAVFFGLQKYFVRGLLAGAVKGG